jgi:hypothetical protein
MTDQNSINNHVQTQFDHVNRELAALHNRRQMLENQQTRLRLLRQFQQHGVTWPDYARFQPENPSYGRLTTFTRLPLDR